MEAKAASGGDEKAWTPKALQSVGASESTKVDSYVQAIVLEEKCGPDCWGGDPKSKGTDYEELFVHPLFVYSCLDPGSFIVVMLYTGLDPEAAKASEL